MADPEQCAVNLAYAATPSVCPFLGRRQYSRNLEIGHRHGERRETIYNTDSGFQTRSQARTSHSLLYLGKGRAESDQVRELTCAVVKMQREK